MPLVYEWSGPPQREPAAEWPQRPDPEGFSGWLRCLARIAGGARGASQLGWLSAREARLARSENRLTHPTAANPAAPLTYPAACPYAQLEPPPDAGLGRLLRARRGRRGPLRQGASAQCQAGRPSGGSLSRPLAIVEAKRCPTNDRTNFITTIARLGQCCCPVAHRWRSSQSPAPHADNNCGSVALRFPMSKF